MTQRYNIYFVPKLTERRKISKLRKEICKKCFTTQALQYPLHLSLTSGTEIKKYKEFEKELLALCKKMNPIKITSSEKMINIYNKIFWTGLSF